MNFFITRQKGFHIKFENGHTVSVQFGPGNYSSNYDMNIGEDEKLAGETGSITAEVAVINPAGELIETPFSEGDSVHGYMKSNKVLELMNWAAQLKEREK